MAGHGHGLASASSLGGCFHGEIGPFRQTEEIGEKRRARARAGGPHARSIPLHWVPPHRSRKIGEYWHSASLVVLMIVDSILVLSVT